ncbi:MAG TPA: flagellar basal body L-ring protein FlgH [Casimicrobiaceae bacterium]|nr:flagellar basal body L-ring protein FlgH [Casimicrobiaceae bacterium]
MITDSLRHGRPLLAVAAAALLCACQPDAIRDVEMHQPLTARPAPYVAGTPTHGAIFQIASTSRGVYQPLFEDRRARAIGDTLTISINEKLNASKTATSDANRKGDMAFVVPDAQIAGHSIKGGSLTAQSKSDFTGGGDSSANNVFTGTIAVTVIDVLPNGNLLVAGEKQIGINQGSEFIRLSGIVNPQHIGYGDVVSSTEVAEARLEYRGSGYINEAQTMGWLARVFQSVMPF